MRPTQTIVPLLLLASLACSATGCSASAEDAGDATATDDVVGGALTREAVEKATVLVDAGGTFGDGAVSFRCSGVLLAPRVVLTSGACARGYTAGYPNAHMSYGVRKAGSSKSDSFSTATSSAWPLTIDDFAHEDEWSTGASASYDAAAKAGRADIGFLILPEDRPLCLDAYPRVGVAEGAVDAFARGRGAYEADGSGLSRDASLTSKAVRLTPAAGAPAFLAASTVDGSPLVDDGGKTPCTLKILGKCLSGNESSPATRGDRGGPVVAKTASGGLAIVAVTTGRALGDKAVVARTIGGELEGGAAIDAAYYDALIDAHGGRHHEACKAAPAGK